MATDVVVLKFCPGCKNTKPIDEFPRHRSRHDGHGASCKRCHSQRVTAASKRPGGGDARRAWTKTPKGRAMMERSKAKCRHTNVGKARNRVATAVRLGWIPRVGTLACAHCGGRAQQYHHHKGYDVPHWLDVIPLCRLCHVRADGQVKHR